MTDNLVNLKLSAEQQFPNFTGSIEIHMYNGEVGTMEKKEKLRYALKNKKAPSEAPV